MSHLNGSAPRAGIEALVRPARGSAYRPHVWVGSRMGQLLDGRPRFTWLEAERMRYDPQIQFGLRILRAPLFGVTWKVNSDSEQVGRWIDREVSRVYRAVLPKFLRHFEYGVACGELTFQARRLPGGKTRVHFHDLGEFHPRDCRPLVYNRGKHGGRLAGMRVSNIQESGAGSILLDRRHSCWFKGDAEYGDWWGRPRLAGAYEPWLEKRGRHGAIDSRRLFYKKGAFRGPTMRHPPGVTDLGTDDTPRLVSNQDIAREIVEKFENGGVMALPGTRDAEGNFLWEWEDPKSFSDVAGLLDYPKQLDREILIGLGIPPELVDAATVGSGYSGRAIPAQVFFCSMDEVASLILACVVEQIIRPLVRINFGRVGFEVVPDSLAKLVARDPAQAGQQGGAGGGQSGPAAGGGGTVPYQGKKGGIGQLNPSTGKVSYGKPKVRLSLTARKRRRGERRAAWAEAQEATREAAREAARDAAREAVREASVGLSLGVGNRAARRLWESCTGPVLVGVSPVRLSQSARSGPPGPPPRPGLVWNPETHRWRNPETGEEHDHVPTPATAAPATPNGLPGVIGEWAAAPTPRAKEYIETALWNVGVEDPGSKKAGRAKVDPQKLARRLGSVWDELHDAGGTPEELAAVGRALAHAGVSVRHAVGERVAVDGRYHEVPPGQFTGDAATVTRPGLVHELPDGREVVLVKAKTAPAGGKGNSDDR